MGNDWVQAQMIFGAMGLLRRLPADRSINMVERIGRKIGRFLPRSNLAHKNLSLAFPEKSKEEVDEIVREMWGNLARTSAEYIFLDQIFDFDDENPNQGRIEVQGVEKFKAIRDTGKPVIFFTGHTGNWEILPVGAAAYGLTVTALFRPPNNKYLAKKLLAARQTDKGHHVPSRAGAAWALAGSLEKGNSIGILVDQYFGRGQDIEFLGRKTKGNPLLAKLARQFDPIEVYPARTVRLPNGRFRIEIEDALTLPRTTDGAIDIQSTTQMINDVVGRWVQQYPAQWLWLHKRWRG